MVWPSKRAFDLRLENECPRWENVPIKGHDLNEKPTIDACELDLWGRVHLEVLCIEDGVLILENRDSVKHLFQHKHLFHITHQTKGIEHWHKNMCEVELK
jgi:hypothetical protein